MSAAPLTAAAALPATQTRLVDDLERFFRRRAPLSPADRVLVAVSGGTDSTALLWGMKRLEERRELDVHAAHLDHRLDGGSAERAEAVARLCAKLDVPLTSARLAVTDHRRSGESLEAAARRVRYRFLGRQRRALGARWALTAHHADDQVETLLLRLIYGSGLSGLAGIAERRGRLLRPLLDLPRRRLTATLEAAGLSPVEDPTNRDLKVPRNLIRHCLIPALETRWPSLRRDLLAVRRTARGARRRLEATVEASTEMRREGEGAGLDLAAFCGLPETLWPFALARACSLAGLPYPPGRDVRRELGRQIAAGGEVGCDQGEGWRWRARDGRLVLQRAPRPHRPEHFSYTFAAPGEVEVPELGVRVRLRPSIFEAWMLRGTTERAGLGLRLQPGEPVTVRSRRPGDRLRPLGCDYRRRLKDVLIDRRVPRRQRDRLPLLEIGDRIVWVPGVTVDHECRLGSGSPVWLAEIEST